ncbi:MFS transporter [Dongia soli]|uniref:MFS transporter n=1 Tax=Dongia soli TaxID=600628 RepID=A0ABU5EGE7_9PROT|nr:MFS transporter [Dongia soli]MDY0885493.1 MFS transporter [Dongia soli]
MLKTITDTPATASTWAIAALSLSMLMPSLDTSIANVALPSLARAFNASFQDMQWILLSYLLAITALIVGAGRLGDIVGRRRLLLAGIGLFTAASLLCGLAPAFWLLLIARVAQGLGAAAMMALAVAMVGETVPKERTGRAMGLLGTMSAIGTSFGPSLGGMLISGFGWRSIFLVNLPLGILNLLLAYRHLPADRQDTNGQRASFDVIGTLLLALSLAAYALAMTLGQGAFGPLNIALLSGAAIGGGVFLLAETKIASPLIRPAMICERKLGAGLIMSALVSTVMMATLVVGPFYLSYALRLDPVFVGMVMSAGPLVAALAGMPAGRLVDRFGAQRSTIMGLAGMTAGLGAVAALPESLGVAGYVLPISIVTAHYALFQAANNTATMTDIRADQRGVISGLLNLSRNLGLVTGASLMGAIFAAAATANVHDVMAADPDAVAAGMRITYAAATVLIVVALVTAVAGRGVPLRRPMPHSL